MSFLARSSCPGLGWDWYSGTISPAPVEVDDHGVGAHLVRAARVGEDARRAGDVHGPWIGRRDPVRVRRVGEEGDLHPVDADDHRLSLRGRRRERARVLDPGVVQCLAGGVDSGLGLVERVVRGRVARVPSGRLDSLRQRRRGVEDRVARRRRRSHRRLDMAKRQVGARDVGLDLLEQGGEVVIAAAERQRSLPDGRVDQQVAAGLDREPHRLRAALDTLRRRRARSAFRRRPRRIRWPGERQPPRPRPRGPQAPPATTCVAGLRRRPAGVWMRRGHRIGLSPTTRLSSRPE